MRFVAVMLIIILAPLAGHASEAPAGQVHIGAGDILRGTFSETHQSAQDDRPPLQSGGHFTVAPAYGLIWGIERPFPTTSIVTPGGMVQDFGGMAVKMPARNLRHIYEMVGGALSGEWGALDKDFIVTPGGTAKHWRMMLTPRPQDKPVLPYASITVTGGRFVESITMSKADGGSDVFAFNDTVLTQGQPTAAENALFGEGRP